MQVLKQNTLRRNRHSNHFFLGRILTFLTLLLSLAVDQTHSKVFAVEPFVLA